MNPSTATIPPPPAHGRPRLPKPLLAVIGLMAVTIAAMGAALVWRSPASTTPPMAAVDAAAQPVAAVPAPSPLADGSTSPTAPGEAAPAGNAVQPAAGAKPAPVASSHRSTHAGNPAAPAIGAPPAPGPVTADSQPAGASPSAHEPLPTPPAVVSVCNSCGTVEAVEAVKQTGKASGLGAVGGAVVGGALGNRMGAGSGKTAMTVLGAIGGGLAGNAIEKHAKAETVYRVKVRMEDGSVKMLTQAKPIAVGAHVTVTGESLKLTAPAGTTPPAPGAST